MDTAFLVLALVHAVISIAIIALVLMQKGKGADAGASFGSGASGTVFGARGAANFLSRATAVMATLFFANSLALAYLTTQQSEGAGSVVEAVETTDAPAIPAQSVSPDDVPSIDDADPEQMLDDAVDAAVDAAEDVPAIESEPAPEDDSQ
ncbi:MAG: preprotein translocase subunit SecG [Pseudomonadota bacterium]